MPRLRVTTGLSMLALVVGTWGTGWLSTFTGDWVGPAPQWHARMPRPPHQAVTHRPRHAPPRVVGAVRETPARTPAPPPELVPVSTPPGPAPWAQLRGHLEGRVVLSIATDGSGRVTAASVARSSGDPVLDAHALATAERWRFAVPAGSPDGVRGELPMRFSSRTQATPP